MQCNENERNVMKARQKNATSALKPRRRNRHAESNTPKATCRKQHAETDTPKATRRKHWKAARRNRHAERNKSKSVRRGNFLAGINDHFYFVSSLENETGGKAGQHSRNFKWSKNHEDGSDFGSIESRRCQLNLPNKSRRRKIFREGKTSKNFAKSSKKLAWFSVSDEQQIETAI